MGCNCKRTILILSALSAVLIGYSYQKLTSIPDLPEIDTEKWWGPGKAQNIDKTIRPFKVEFTDAAIADLKSRLEKTRPLQEPLEGVGFEYGFNNNYLKEVIEFWRKSYNFKERETFLNKYPQFKTNIQGLDIHYIHVKPKVTGNQKVLPLLLVHGWPGSVREFYEMIPLLTTPRKDQDFVFEIIVPSLPGYGFSQAAAKQGLDTLQIAVIMRNLLQRIGHKQYYVHGGDWGSMIVNLITTFFPKEVLGYHATSVMPKREISNLKLFLGTICSSLVVDKAYADRVYPLGEKFMFLLEESGYMHIQATKPDTVGIGLRDSPAGLAAYILEKFSTWTNREWRKLADGGLTKKHTLTNLLDNIMIYWTTGTITTSQRLYSEVLNSRFEGLNLGRQLIYVPTAIANFKHELLYMPETIVRDNIKNLVQFTHYEDGGHFASFELPEIMSEDIWSFVDKTRNLTQ